MPEIKPKIFIASSGENAPVCEALAARLQRAGMEVTVWNQNRAFPQNRSLFEHLYETVGSYDFFVLFFAPDDPTIRRGRAARQTRAAVVFEAGLAMGALGRERVIIVTPENNEGFVLNADLEGIRFHQFDYNAFQEQGSDYIGLSEIEQVIRTTVRNAANWKWFRKLHGFFGPPNQWLEKSGLTSVWESRTDAKERILQDIREASSSVRFVSRVYHSELFKDANVDVERALSTALTNNQNHSIEIEFLSTNWNLPQELCNNLQIPRITQNSNSLPDNLAVVEQLHRIESIPNEKRWPTLSDYQKHLYAASTWFDKIQNNLVSQHSNAIFSRRFVHGYLLPYSMVIIDSQIIYVSFYTLHKHNTYGTSSPTVRVESDNQNEQREKHWVRVFLEEYSKMRSLFVRDGEY